jgi:WD40 repeat protein
LNKAEIVSVDKSAHGGHPINFITYLSFDDKDMFISGSAGENSIKLWIKQDAEDKEYRILRKRQGCSHELKGIRFYDPEGFHIIGYTAGESAEIIDYSVLREDMTTGLSQKINNKGLNKYTKTERDEKIGEVLSIDFSTNRARDWANLITANKNNNRPCFWDVENKSIVKIGISTYDTMRVYLWFIRD